MTDFTQRAKDEAALFTSAQRVYAGQTTSAAHQALLDAFRATYGGSVGLAAQPAPAAYPDGIPFAPARFDANGRRIPGF